MGNPHVVLRPISISPENAQAERARAWAFVIDCYRTKKAAASSLGRPNDAKEIKNDSRHHHRST
jgi:hypothetical protein